jgi:hypothetical protein
MWTFLSFAPGRNPARFGVFNIKPLYIIKRGQTKEMILPRKNRV